MTIDRGMDKEGAKMWYTYRCVCVCVCVCMCMCVCVCVMEHHSAIKKNEIMPFAATWMDLDIILLNEIRQTGKDKYHVISLICRI